MKKGGGTMADSKVKRDNYLTIQGWMLTDLGLKGNELLIYACIYGFSQLDNQVFSGGRQYLADWTNSTKKSVDKCLKSLCERGLLERKEYLSNGMKLVDYIAARGSEQSSPWVGNKVPQGGEQNSPGVGNFVPQGGEQSSPNNINIINTYSIDNKKDNAGAPAPIPSHPPDGKATGKKPGIDTEAIFRRYTQDEKVLSLLRDWLKVRKAKRAPETEKALTLNLDKLATLARNSSTSQAEYLEAVIARGWAAFYPLNNWSKPVPVRHTVKTEADHAAGGHASGFGW